MSKSNDEKKAEKKSEKLDNKLSKEVEKLQSANAELNDKALRLVAENQNMRRRYEEEVSKLLRYEGEDFIKEILNVLDDFERAINLDDTNLDDEVSKFLSGFKMIYANLLNILEKFEVEEIKALGEQFDPEKMNAVMTDYIETEEVNIVLDVMQKGYTYKGKVIRPAMVKVNQ